MRLLFAIPHHFDPEPGKPKAGKHGSLRRDPAPRVEALSACVSALHQHFGPRQCVLDIATKTAQPAAQDLAAEVDVLICTTQGRHLLDKLALPKDLWQHHATQAEPLLLGFECQAALAERLGIYDWYCYLEDDLILHDPLFFAKLAWFASYAGDGALLQPNRFERARSGPFHKSYVDGDLAPRVTAPFQDVADRPRLTGLFLDRTVHFDRARNPHSGCYFLNARQMERFANHPAFLRRDDTRFVGPLESAATLGVMQAFRVYKPAPPCAGFLEVEHHGTSFLSLVGTVVSIPPRN
jgi:hypothetical protein